MRDRRRRRFFVSRVMRSWIDGWKIRGKQRRRRRRRRRRGERCYLRVCVHKQNSWAVCGRDWRKKENERTKKKPRERKKCFVRGATTYLLFSLSLSLSFYVAAAIVATEHYLSRYIWRECVCRLNRQKKRTKENERIGFDSTCVSTRTFRFLYSSTRSLWDARIPTWIHDLRGSIKVGYHHLRR